MKIMTRVWAFGLEFSEDAEPLAGPVGAAGGEVLHADNGRLILQAPIGRAEEVEAALEAAQSEGVWEATARAVYDLPAPSGKKIVLNLRYEDNGQVVSATVDERLWALMTSADAPTATADAVLALNEDLEIACDARVGRGLELQDVMEEVRFWKGTEEALKWDPEMWAEDEPMTEVEFTAQAEVYGTGEIVEAVIPSAGASTVFFEIPSRLVPRKDPRVGHDGLAHCPAAQDEVRAWARVAPFRIELRKRRQKRPSAQAL